MPQHSAAKVYTWYEFPGLHFPLNIGLLSYNKLKRVKIDVSALASGNWRHISGGWMDVLARDSICGWALNGLHPSLLDANDWYGATSIRARTMVLTVNGWQIASEHIVTKNGTHGWENAYLCGPIN
jgi:hypothetical protein